MTLDRVCPCEREKKSANVPGLAESGITKAGAAVSIGTTAPRAIEAWGTPKLS
jgi:hypothetical protein